MRSNCNGEFLIWYFNTETWNNQSNRKSEKSKITSERMTMQVIKVAFSDEVIFLYSYGRSCVVVNLPVFGNIVFWAHYVFG